MRTNRRLSISCGGISLLEVLAALFVVTIGLLCVLAVIPFGAYQVSKAQHAEYAANMLANACEEIFIREMTNPAEWDPPAAALDYTKFVWVEPYSKTPIDPIFYAPVQKWRGIMQGQDDLKYTTYSGKRPDFAGQNNKIQSTGTYTWFFTFLPKSGGSKVNVDVLACHNRVPEDDKQVAVQSGNFTASSTGGTFTLGFGLMELLTETKYVFVTWKQESELDGTWCKIVFLDKSNPASPRIVVTGNLPDLNDSGYSDIQVYIPSGVLYHKRLESVAIE